MAKQLEISEDKIDVEYLILKRRLYENIIYPQKKNSGILASKWKTKC